jgi:acyl-CoA dehydrogenase
MPLSKLWTYLLSPKIDIKDLAPSPVSFASWWAKYRELAREWDPLERAVIGGALTDILAFAFAGGYQAALRHMVPSLSNDQLVSFAITEEGGGHPRAICATLTPADKNPKGGYFLSGHKKWITLAAEASTLLVAASTGRTSDGLNQIHLVSVPSNAVGVSIKPMKNITFVPEISHGEVYLENVKVSPDAILPGDGYMQYIRPFRTVEDLFVSAGFLGYCFRVASDYQWPREVFEKLACLVASLDAITHEDANAPETHIALSGFLAMERKLVQEIDPLWERVSDDVRERWNRDKALLQVAEKLRGVRLDTAWKKIGGQA